MTPAEIGAILGGVPSITAAVIAIIVAIKSNAKSTSTATILTTHIQNPDMHPLAPSSFQERTGTVE
jgi:hypothetical protein